MTPERMHMYVWSRAGRWFAVAQAGNVLKARERILEEIGDCGDGSTPERAAARAYIQMTNPDIWHSVNAEFGLTDSASLAEADAEIDTLRSALQQAGRNSLPCGLCALPVVFEFTVESDQWNRLVRAKGINEYLCFWCFDKIALEAGETVDIGVNINGRAAHSQWCCDDVPGAHPNDVTKAHLRSALQVAEQEKEGLLGACKAALASLPPDAHGLDWALANQLTEAIDGTGPLASEAKVEELRQENQRLKNLAADLAGDPSQPSDADKAIARLTQENARLKERINEMSEPSLVRDDVIRAIKSTLNKIREGDGKGNNDSQRLRRAGVSELEHFLELAFMTKETTCDLDQSRS